MAKELNITESKRSDISTVYAYLTVPEEYPAGYPKLCDSFSCFNDTYERDAEREFIKQLDAEHPGRYSHYHIGWVDCN